MKKSVLCLFIFSLLILSLTCIYAQAPEEIIDPETAEKLEEFVEDPEQVSTDYMKQEWTKILEGNAFGRFFLGIGKVFEFLNPVWKIFIGIEYSMSWLFFISLIIGITVFILIYQPLRAILQFNPWISSGIALVILAIAAPLHIIEIFVKSLTPILTNRWMVTLSIIIAAVIIFFYSWWMKSFRETFKKHIEKETKARQKQKAKAVEKIHDVELKGRGMK